jgi:hypothetical protein
MFSLYNTNRIFNYYASFYCLLLSNPAHIDAILKLESDVAQDAMTCVVTRETH